MDLLKTKIYLDKLQREFTRLNKDPENIARIDVDIMASYVRELYDALLADDVPAVAKPATVVHTPRKQAPVHSPVVAPPPAFVPPPPEPAPPPPAPAPMPVLEEKPPVVEVPPPPAPARSHHVSHHTSHHPTDAEVLFEEKQVKELSEKLAEQPVADLKKAIALNDRLLLTRELFSGDGKAFEAALHSLNHFSGFDEAKAYLLEHCISRYMWLDKKRVDEAKKFIKLVRRRYK
ncbi:MAG: hypothetical protein DYG98_03665 [Haliscomenobacteraceae bacterium CHB4]|nr:hypothetical protein [Haliscomenobacteraceae bacterium CHB4]